MTQPPILSPRILVVEDEGIVAILNSIGDAVIATDANGIVNFMNHTAEILTSWSTRAAYHSGVRTGPRCDGLCLSARLRKRDIIGPKPVNCCRYPRQKSASCQDSM
jgi:PAS domain-containing protein